MQREYFTRAVKKQIQQEQQTLNEGPEVDMANSGQDVSQPTKKNIHRRKQKPHNDFIMHKNNESEQRVPKSVQKEQEYLEVREIWEQQKLEGKIQSNLNFEGDGNTKDFSQFPKNAPPTVQPNQNLFVKNINFKDAHSPVSRLSKTDLSETIKKYSHRPPDGAKNTGNNLVSQNKWLKTDLKDESGPRKLRASSSKDRIREILNRSKSRGAFVVEQPFIGRQSQTSTSSRRPKKSMSRSRQEPNTKTPSTSSVNPLAKFMQSQEKPTALSQAKKLLKKSQSREKLTVPISSLGIRDLSEKVTGFLKNFIFGNKSEESKTSQRSHSFANKSREGNKTTRHLPTNLHDKDDLMFSSLQTNTFKKKLETDKQAETDPLQKYTFVRASEELKQKMPTSYQRKHQNEISNRKSGSSTTFMKRELSTDVRKSKTKDLNKMRKSSSNKNFYHLMKNNSAARLLAKNIIPQENQDSSESPQKTVKKPLGSTYGKDLGLDPIPSESPQKVVKRKASTKSGKSHKSNRSAKSSGTKKSTQDTVEEQKIKTQKVDKEPTNHPIAPSKKTFSVHQQSLFYWNPNSVHSGNESKSASKKEIISAKSPSLIAMVEPYHAYQLPGYSTASGKTLQAKKKVYAVVLWKKELDVEVVFKDVDLVIVRQTIQVSRTQQPDGKRYLYLFCVYLSHTEERRLKCLEFVQQHLKVVLSENKEQTSVILVGDLNKNLMSISTYTRDKSEKMLNEIAKQLIICHEMLHNNVTRERIILNGKTVERSRIDWLLFSKRGLDIHAFPVTDSVLYSDHFAFNFDLDIFY